MKDRIGQSSKKKKPAEQGASSVTGVPKPDSFAGYSGGGKQPNSKLPLIIGAVVVLVMMGRFGEDMMLIGLTCLLPSCLLTWLMPKIGAQVKRIGERKAFCQRSDPASAKDAETVC